MKKVYESQDYTRVGYFQSILEEEGIRTTIKNYGASAAMGELPFTEVFPELWILDDGQFDRAMKLVREELDTPPTPSTEEWKCPRCGSTVDAGFTKCWKCGNDKAG